jgi:hypothetical protein
MKKIGLALLTACFCLHGFAQKADFEMLTLPTSQYWKGVTGVPGLTSFQSGSFSFTNRNDTSSFGDYWSGWGYSATTDTLDPTYANEMSAITGKGYNNSQIYGVAYQSFDSLNNIIRLSSPSILDRCYVTNTTVAYYSMLNGDGFAKKFGGSSGNDPDYFKLNITGWYQGTPLADTIHVYLADFRDSMNTNDFILKDWYMVNLFSLGVVDSLTYTIESSDNNSFGMKTPAYFCIDDLMLTPVSVSDINNAGDLELFPVPAKEYLYVQNKSEKQLTLQCLNMKGQRLFINSLKPYEKSIISMNDLASGIYLLEINDGRNKSYKQFSKE